MAAVSSHQLRLPLPEIPGIELMPMVFFREPLDRAQSVWSFERRQRSDSPGAQHAKKLSVDGYVRWRLDQGEISVISDFQTGVVGRDEPGGVDVGLAAGGSGLRVGRRSRAYDGEHVRRRARLRRAFPAIDLSFVSRNVTGRGRRPRSSGCDFFELLGPALAAELRGATPATPSCTGSRTASSTAASRQSRSASALIGFDRRCRAREGRRGLADGDRPGAGLGPGCLRQNAPADLARAPPRVSSRSTAPRGRLAAAAPAIRGFGGGDRDETAGTNPVIQLRKRFCRACPEPEDRDRLVDSTPGGSASGWAT